MGMFKPVGWDTPGRKKKRRRSRSPRPPSDIAVVCPWCNKELRVEAKWVGYTVSCPFCEDRFVAEALDSSSTPSRSRPFKRPTTGNNNFSEQEQNDLDNDQNDSDICDDPVDIDETPLPVESIPNEDESRADEEPLLPAEDPLLPDEGNLASEPTIPMSPPEPPPEMGMVKCPFCAEHIKSEAILCKHCKSRLD